MQINSKIFTENMLLNICQPTKHNSFVWAGVIKIILIHLYNIHTFIHKGSLQIYKFIFPHFDLDIIVPVPLTLNNFQSGEET